MAAWQLWLLRYNAVFFSTGSESFAIWERLAFHFEMNSKIGMGDGTNIHITVAAIAKPRVYGIMLLIPALSMI